MNNSKIALNNFEEDKIDLSNLQKQQGELSQVVEAVNGIEASEDWQKLKKMVLDGVIENLERQISNEVSRKEINLPEVYRLQGQIMWAKKYVDLKKLSEFFKLQLEGIKNKLKNDK